MWVKQMPDGTTIEAPTVEGPGFALGLDDRVGADGWVWMDNPEAQIVEVPKPAIAQLVTNASEAQTVSEYDAAIATFLSVVE